MKTEAANLAAADGIRHGFFSARGGVSEGGYASLNCGLGSSDRRDHVDENRRRVATDLGTDAARLITPHQVHSPTAVIVSEPWPEEDRPQVDAIVTSMPGLAVGVLTADCAPVLYCDPVARVVAAAHAGWRGAVGGVLEDAVEKMERLGARRERIRAAVGPCISFAVYEVGDAFRDEFLALDPANERFFGFPEGARKVHFDLSAYAVHRLRAAGLSDVVAIDHCTFRLAPRYYSYRRSQQLGQSDYGRQISAIVIE